jgi:hypothetical protein
MDHLFFSPPLIYKQTSIEHMHFIIQKAAGINNSTCTVGIPFLPNGGGLQSPQIVWLHLSLKKNFLKKERE